LPLTEPLLPLLPSTLGLTPLTLHGNNCFDFYFFNVIGWHVTQSILFPPLFGGRPGGGVVFFKTENRLIFMEKTKKKMVPSTYSIKAPFFFHCEPALGSSLALNKFSFRLDKGCTPQTPPPPQFIEPNDPIIFRNTHVQGAFCITKKDLNKNFIMVQ
jgi:hypothetical protein